MRWLPLFSRNLFFWACWHLLVIRPLMTPFYWKGDYCGKQSIQERYTGNSQQHFTKLFMVATSWRLRVHLRFHQFTATLNTSAKFWYFSFIICIENSFILRTTLHHFFIDSAVPRNKCYLLKIPASVVFAKTDSCETFFVAKVGYIALHLSVSQ